MSSLVHLSTLIIAGNVLLAGVDTAWAGRDTFTRLCQVSNIRLACLLAFDSSFISTPPPV